MARTKNPRMRRKAQIKAKWHRRKVRRAAGIILPSGKKETPVPPPPEPMPEPVAAQPEAPVPEAPAPEPTAVPEAPEPDA